MEQPDKIRVVIVDDIPETRDNLRKLLQFEPDIEVVGQASTGDEGVQAAKEHRPHIVLMDINMPGLDGIAATEAITREVPVAQIVMMSVQSEADYIRRSMLAGARDFLIKPFSGDELIATIRRVYERGPKFMPQMAADPRDGLPGGPAVARGPRGKVVAVFSAKGGAGCSVIAANVAVALAQMGKETVAVDASLAFGDLGVLLDLHGTHSIVDLADRLDEMDADLVTSVLATHGTGLRVLLAPPRPEMAELVTAESVKRILALMRQRFEYIVIDTFTSLQDIMLTTLDGADKILLVTTPDIPSIKDTRLFFEVVDQLDYHPDKSMLVLNRVDRHSGITADDVQTTLKKSVAAVIPADNRAVMYSVNQGVPFVLRESSKPIAQAIIQLTNDLVAALDAERVPESEEMAQVGRSRLGRLFGNR